MLPVVRAIHWMTAVALLATLYGHAVMGMDRSDVSTVPALAVFALLTAGAACSIPMRNYFVPTSPMRWLSFWLAVWAWTFLTVIGLIHFVEETPQIKDLGDFAVLCILPILIGLQAQRKDLIYKILALCAVAALADAAWNAATYLRFVQPIKDTGRLTAYGMMKRYPGLTGSTLAGGLISFLGVCFLAFRFSTSRWLGLRPFILLALGAIFIDMLLIDARRYTGVSIVACFILMTPWVNRRAVADYRRRGRGTVSLLDARERRSGKRHARGSDGRRLGRCDAVFLARRWRPPLRLGRAEFSGSLVSRDHRKRFRGPRQGLWRSLGRGLRTRRPGGAGGVPTQDNRGCRDIRDAAGDARKRDRHGPVSERVGVLLGFFHHPLRGTAAAADEADGDEAACGGARVGAGAAHLSVRSLDHLAAEAPPCP
jgi:hypothetical protein